MHAMRKLTAWFKSILGLGFEPKPYITEHWAAIRNAAISGSPGNAALAQSLKLFDKLIALVTDLPMPTTSEADGVQTDLPKPEDKPPGDPPGKDISEGNRG